MRLMDRSQTKGEFLWITKISGSAMWDVFTSVVTKIGTSGFDLPLRPWRRSVADLSAEEIRLFRHNGYLKLREGLSDPVAQEIRDLAHDHLAREVEPVVRNDEGKPVRLSKALERDPVFERAVRHPVVVDPLRALLGQNFVVRKNRHNHLTLNPPDIRPDSFHRDNMQWTRAIVTIICYLEDDGRKRVHARRARLSILAGSGFRIATGERSSYRRLESSRSGRPGPDARRRVARVGQPCLSPDRDQPNDGHSNEHDVRLPRRG